MNLLSVWGVGAFGLVVGWACLLVVADRLSIRATVFSVVFLSTAVALAYFMVGVSGAVEVAMCAIAGLLFHRILRAALWRRAHQRRLSG